MEFDSTAYLLLCGLVLLVLAAVIGGRSRRRYAPGPRPWPIIGSLHLMAGYDLPYKAFDELAKRYGPVVSLKLGSRNCLVLSSLDVVKEVLINKGEHFDGRPDFARYHHLFGGDRNNSLAFCDMTDLHKSRREMIREHTFPRAFSNKFHQLENIILTELSVINQELGRKVVKDIKPLILHSIGNIFFSYFSSISFSINDNDYAKMLKDFDEIFYEVNQGYAPDFIPWLSPLLMFNNARTRKWGVAVRKFMEDRVVSTGGQEGDLLHALLQNVQAGQMDKETAMFAFEDIIGGHCAISNFLVKLLAFISQYPEVQKKMQEEVDAVTCGKPINLGDKAMMPYTEAVILECIRHVCSPIVPHVASQDTTINDYHVDKGTLIFLNNYTLNMSEGLWKEPNKFDPSRFLTESGALQKPEHFLPFGGGRRSCMGNKMTQVITFATLATFMQHYTILPGSSDMSVQLGNLALPYQTVQFNFLTR